MGKRGGNKYVPRNVLNELNDIMREDQIPEQAEAFNTMVKYSRVGREVKRLASLDWTRKKKKGDIF